MPTINHNDGVYTSAWLITKKGLHSFKWTIAIGVLDTPINAEEDNQLRHESEFIKLRYVRKLLIGYLDLAAAIDFSPED